jgi:Ni/Co efflux regulator RcnB
MELIMKPRAILLAMLAISLTAFSAGSFAQGDGDLAAQERATRQVNRESRRAAREQGYYRYGDRLPLEYRNRQYLVEDWRGHRLSAPPRGYHWVQIGGEYALVANHSGVIRQWYPAR